MKRNRRAGVEDRWSKTVRDEQGKLIYNGAIDDDPSGRNETPKRRNYVDQALAAHGAGKAVDPANTQPYGCSVKY